MKNTTPPSAGRAQRTVVFALIAAALLVVLLLMGYERWLSYWDALRDAETKTFNYAAIVETRLDATLRRADAVLQEVVAETPIEALSQASVGRFSASINRSLDLNIANFEEVFGLRIYDANGDFLYGSRSGLAPRPNIADRDYFLQSKKYPKADLGFSAVLTISSSGRRGVIISRVFLDSRGSFAGLALAILDLDVFRKIFETLDVGQNGVLIIRRVNDFSAVLRRPHLDTELNNPLPPGNPMREAILAGKRQGTLEYPASSDGVTRICSYRSLATYPFFVVAGLSRGDVLASWYKQAATLGVVAALLLMLLAGLFRYLWRMAERETAATTRLRTGEERLRLATAAGGIGLYDLNVQTGKAVVNDEYASMLGYDPAKFEESNQAWVERLHPDDQAHTFARYSDNIVGKSDTYSVEFRQLTASGDYRWIQSQGSLVERDGEGKPLRMLGTHVDITAQKHTENALRELNARLDFLLSSSPVTLYTCQAAQPFAPTFISRNITAMLGYAPDDFLNTPNFWADHLHPDDRERVFASLGEVFVHAHHEHEYRFRHVDGSWRFMEDAVRLVKDKAGNDVELIGYFIDVTERRNAQQDLLVKQAAMESSLNAIAMTGLDRVITYVNRAFVETWRLHGPEQAIGHLPREFIADAPRLVEIMLRDGRWEGEMQGHRADGSTIELQVAAHLVKDENGRPMCMMASFVDITLRKQAEEGLHNLNVELESRVQERTAKLEAVNKELETFTYSVSHDLRAPLRGIDGYSNLLLEDYASVLDASGKKYLANVRKAAQQMGTLIDDLLAYSRVERRELELTPLNPGGIVEALLSEFDGDIKAKNVIVTVNLDCEAVRADREALAMAMRNLIGNALKFSHAAGQPRVEIGSGERAGYHQLWVRDNGIGFDMKYHDQIFTIFKRLERGEKYPGTGVGLAIVKKAMERIGGKVWAESEPGRGAVFYLEIPK